MNDPSSEPSANRSATGNTIIAVFPVADRLAVRPLDGSFTARIRPGYGPASFVILPAFRQEFPRAKANYHAAHLANGGASGEGMRTAKIGIAGVVMALTAWNGSGAARAQMVTGASMPGYAEAFGVAANSREAAYAVALVESSIPGNVLYPGEQPKFTFQIVNRQDKPIDAQGKAEIIAYGTKGQPGDIWAPRVVKFGSVASVPFAAHIAAKGFADFTIAPKIPAAFGAYALIVDLGPLGRQFVTSCGRTFAASTQRIQYPKFCLDDINLDVLKRLGVQAIRHGISYKPTSEPDFEAWYAEEGRKLKRFQDANIAVLMMVGAGRLVHARTAARTPAPLVRHERRDAATRKRTSRGFPPTTPILRNTRIVSPRSMAGPKARLTPFRCGMNPGKASRFRVGALICCAIGRCTGAWRREFWRRERTTAWICWSAAAIPPPTR